MHDLRIQAAACVYQDLGVFKSINHIFILEFCFFLFGN